MLNRQPQGGSRNDYQFRNFMKKRVLVLGAGFGGMELSTMLSEEFGDRARSVHQVPSGWLVFSGRGALTRGAELDGYVPKARS